METTKLINKRSGRKRNYDYELKEKEYQEAQEHWDKYQDKKSWDAMFLDIHLCVFNTINKKLERVLDKETIEERAMDITIGIMSNIKKRRDAGKPWKIGKVSSFVYLPCLSIYHEKLKFNDKILDQSAYTYIDEMGNERIMEFEDSYMENGIYHLHGDY